MPFSSLIRALPATLVAAALLLLGGCTLSRAQILKADQVIAQAQPKKLDCQQADHCAQASPLLQQARKAMSDSTRNAPVHKVTLLDDGDAALAARINLIGAARRSIEVQTYIWEQDDIGKLMLDELVRAARRGVHVRILADQLFSFDSVELLARLARTHANFQVRLYNPTFDDGKTPPLEFAAGVLCCFFNFNQRMHNKLVLIDNTIGITGGRNYENRYFAWDPEFDYRDRDVMVGGPAAQTMADTFELFWDHPRSKPLAQLRDVNKRLIADGPDAPGWTAPSFDDPQRVARARAQAENPQWLQQHLLAHTLRVGRVDFFSDYPAKTDDPHRRTAHELTGHIMQLVAGAKHQVVLQTPYLVLSRRARRIFKRLHKRAHPPQVIVSTNSLASTDAFAVYAMSYKHKKRYLKDYGFQIHELKPHPADIVGVVPIIEASASAEDSDSAQAADDGSAATSAASSSAPQGHTPVRVLGSSGSSTRYAGRNHPAPLITKGIRVGLHAKSLVIDDNFAMVGSHNFDPRSDHYNTESGVIVYDHRFANQLRGEILLDTLPRNAWTIARRQSKIPVLTYVNQAIGTVSEHLPLFDLWPFRYATSYELKPGCKPIAPGAPGFFECYQPVGDFPDVALSFKTIYTRLFTAFGSSLTGIL